MSRQRKLQIVLEVLIILALLAFLVGQVYTEPERQAPMAVDFGTSGNKGVSFGSLAQTQGLTNMSVSFWMYYNAVRSGDYGDVVSQYDDAGHGWWIDLVDYVAPNANNLTFGINFSDTDGGWKLPTDTLTAGNRYHVTITYNRSATTNDPVFYINGAEVAESEVSTPVGAAATDVENLVFGYGGYGGAGNGTYVILSDVRIYNRILAAGEVAEIYNSRDINAVPYGLVFQATFLENGAYIDRINGAVGTGAGSPAFVPDTILNWH